MHIEIIYIYIHTHYIYIYIYTMYIYKCICLYTHVKVCRCMCICTFVLCTLCTYACMPLRNATSGYRAASQGRQRVGHRLPPRRACKGRAASPPKPGANCPWSTEVPLGRNALSVCACGDPWGTPLNAEISY